MVEDLLKKRGCYYNYYPRRRKIRFKEKDYVSALKKQGKWINCQPTVGGGVGST